MNTTTTEINGRRYRVILKEIKEKKVVDKETMRERNRKNQRTYLGKEENREKSRARAKSYYERNKAKVRAQQKAYRLKKKENEEKK